MAARRRSQPVPIRAFVYALLVHLVLLLVLGFSFNWQLTPGQDSAGQQEVVQAHVVDGAALRAEMERVKEEQAAEQRREQERREEVERLKREAVEAEARRVAEEKQLALLKKKEEEDRRKKEAAEKRRTEEEKKQAETKRRKEEEKKQQDAEKRRAAEAHKRRQAEAEAAERKRAEQELQEQMRAEATARRASAEFGRFQDPIRQKINRNWIRPVDAGESYRATVLVRVTPGGEVLGVTIVESSGNEAFDRSVVAAVYKSTPLPFPEDREVAEYISRQGFRFNFIPQKG